MNNLTVHIVRKGDEPPISMTDKDKILYVQAQKFFVIEGGTESGMPSVILTGTDDKSCHAIIETTGVLFNAMHAAYKGACENFGVPPDGLKPSDDSTRLLAAVERPVLDEVLNKMYTDDILIDEMERRGYAVKKTGTPSPEDANTYGRDASGNWQEMELPPKTEDILSFARELEYDVLCNPTVKSSPALLAVLRFARDIAYDMMQTGIAVNVSMKDVAAKPELSERYSKQVSKKINEVLPIDKTNVSGKALYAMILASGTGEEFSILSNINPDQVSGLLMYATQRLTSKQEKK